MTLLASLAGRPMPATVADCDAILELGVLVIAGHVYATIPVPRLTTGGQWHQDPATVYQVTALGHQVLRYFGPGSGYAGDAT